MRHAYWSAMLLLAFLVGCAASPLTEYRLHSSATPRREDALQAIACCAAQMEESVEAIRRLRDSSAGESEYLQPREHDLLEQRLAVFLSCRRELNQIAQREPLNSFLRRESLSNRNRCDVALATLSVEDPVLWRAMNQSFHRSRILEGSCDRILHEVTAARDPSLPQEQLEQLQRVVSRRGVLLPTVENELNHTPPAEVLVDVSLAFSLQVRRCQNVLISGTGRIKNPVARPLTFSEEQRRQIRNALQPGDVLLTYTEGNASNLFIPGNFKHAATFVGTPAERRRAGLSPEKLLAVAGPNVRVLTQVCNESTTKTGEEADVVESLAEGVQFCNFQTLLTTRINRLVVLRPQLNSDERAAQIADVLSYVGDEYDFSFDLTDASNQVCTEVVYRSLQGRGGIDLPLSEHLWRLTLTADDILRCCVRDGGEQLACILVVDEARETPGSARILYATEAQEWLSRLPGLGK